MSDLDVEIVLSADRPDLVDQLAHLYWKEWGKPDDLQEWIDNARKEGQGRAGLPVSFLAVNHDSVVGGVAINIREGDMPDDETRKPWITGTLVNPEWRSRGVGTMLFIEVDRWLRSAGVKSSWVLTGGDRAISFYEKCGYVLVEHMPIVADDAVVLTKRH